MRARPANATRACLALGVKRALRHAAALCLALLLAAPAHAAAPSGMAMDVLDSITKSPASRRDGSTATDFSKTGAGKAATGPAAPTAPVAPVVPGALAPSTQARPQRQEAPAAPPVSPASPAHPAPAAKQHSAPQVLILTHDGAERRALITQPKIQARKKGQAAPLLPVIIFLHGAGGSAAQAMRQTNLAARAAAAGFLTVFPEGLGPAEARGEGQTWNAWRCCGYARDARVDDVGFLSVLVNRLRQDYRADPERIHLAGFSNGAMLASRFALERPGVAASLVSVAGYLPCDAPAPTEALPVLIVHGDRDQVARFAPTAAHPATGRFCEDHPARAQADFWVRSLDLAPAPKVRETAAARVEESAPGKKGGRGFLRFVIVQGGGHAWPGGPRERFRYCDAPSSAVDATGLLLEFCAGRRR